jgi:hypothetical protein
MEQEGLLPSPENFRTTANQVLRIAFSHMVSRYREIRQIKASSDSHPVVATVVGSKTFRAISEEYELPPSSTCTIVRGYSSNGPTFPLDAGSSDSNAEGYLTHPHPDANIATTSQTITKPSRQTCTSPPSHTSEERLDTVVQGHDYAEIKANSQLPASIQPLDSGNLVDYNFHDWLVRSYHPNAPAPGLLDIWSHNDVPDQLQIEESFGLNAGLVEVEAAFMQMEDFETAFWFD